MMLAPSPRPSPRPTGTSFGRKRGEGEKNRLAGSRSVAQVIDDDYVVTRLGERDAGVRADVAGTAGD